MSRIFGSSTRIKKLGSFLKKSKVMLLRLLPIVQIETIVVRSPENHPIWCFPSWTCYGQLPSRIMAVRTILGGISNAVYPGTGAFPRGACCERGGLSRGFMKSEWGRRTFYWIKLQETKFYIFSSLNFPLFCARPQRISPVQSGHVRALQRCHLFSSIFSCGFDGK